MSSLLALDPALNSPGVALFRNRVLTSAERLRQPKAQANMPIGERALTVAHNIFEFWRACDLYGTTVPGARIELVYELPQWYTAAKSEGDPNDLVGLALVAAAVSGLMSAWHDITVASPTPAEWTGGQLPKSKTGDPWKSPRGIRVRSRLSPEEIKCVQPSHDAIDAVGIGLWRLGRFERRRVFPGASDG